MGPGSQACRRERATVLCAADGSSEMATLVAVTGIGQWWDEIDGWDESPIGDHRREDRERGIGDNECRQLFGAGWLQMRARKCTNEQQGDME